MRLEWKMKSERFVCLSRMMLERDKICQLIFDWNGLAKTPGHACNIREERDQLRGLREDVHIGVRDLGGHSCSGQVLGVLVFRTNALARCAAEALEVVLGVACHG